jgi:hypothetical protein
MKGVRKVYKRETFCIEYDRAPPVYASLSERGMEARRSKRQILQEKGALFISKPSID